MQIISSNNSIIEIGDLESSSFQDLINNQYSQSKKIILVDENTHAHCLPRLLTGFDGLSHAEIVQIPAGEENKQIDIVAGVWEALTEYGIERYDLLINLGGGMITDMGGFIASCYKRGIHFVNVPTTLLAMVDASIGGKTGINLGPYKNQVGVFANPVATYVDQSFLSTLPKLQLMSGYAEMIKHAVLKGKDLFQRVEAQMENPWQLDDSLLKDCIDVKREIVEKDFREAGERKLLNFGHTIGHAIEGRFMGDQSYTHGYCIAMGMLIENQIGLLRSESEAIDCARVSALIQKHYDKIELNQEDLQVVSELILNDKKNKSGEIMCVLMNQLGNCSFDNSISVEEVREAIVAL